MSDCVRDYQESFEQHLVAQVAAHDHDDFAPHSDKAVYYQAFDTLVLRKATMDDFALIEANFANARTIMAERGNPTQWGNTFPKEEVILHDIAIGRFLLLIALDDAASVSDEVSNSAAASNGQAVMSDANAKGDADLLSQADRHIIGYQQNISSIQAFNNVHTHDESIDVLAHTPPLRYNQVDRLRETIVAQFAVCFGEDQAYGHIDGSWLNEEPYVTLHRVAATGAVRGVAPKLLTWAVKQYGNVRCETHPNNYAMQRACEKANYYRCGEVLLADREFDRLRIAYQADRQRLALASSQVS